MGVFSLSNYLSTRLVDTTPPDHEQQNHSLLPSFFKVSTLPLITKYFSQTLFPSIVLNLLLNILLNTDKFTE